MKAEKVRRTLLKHVFLSRVVGSWLSNVFINMDGEYFWTDISCSSLLMYFHSDELQRGVVAARTATESVLGANWSILVDSHQEKSDETSQTPPSKSPLLVLGMY